MRFQRCCKYRYKIIRLGDSVPLIVHVSDLASIFTILPSSRGFFVGFFGEWGGGGVFFFGRNFKFQKGLDVFLEPWDFACKTFQTI